MNILLLGANGQVGTDIQHQFKVTHHRLTPLTRQTCDLSNSEDIETILSDYSADLVINAAAYTAVDHAETEKNMAEAINIHAVEKIALFCKKKSIPLIHLSTDYVFDGTKKTAYQEDDRPNPLNVYGHTKLDGEDVIRQHLERYIILRVSWVFGSHGKNFVKTILNLAKSRDTVSVVNDQWGCPTAAKDIARVILAITHKIAEPTFNQWGIYHYCGQDKTNWHQFAQCIVNTAQQQHIPMNLTHLENISSENYPFKATRPTNTVLSTQKIRDVFQINSEPWFDYLPEVITSLK